MNFYLAKSNPKETIQEHTDNLLENFKILKKVYPNLDVNWDILYLACLYHDLGKMNLNFQARIHGRKIPETEIPHSIMSLSFINPKKLKLKGYTNDEIKVLAHSVAYHHDRELSYGNLELERDIELMKEELDNFQYDKLEEIQIRKLSAKFFSKDRLHEQGNEEQLFFKYVLIKGLLNRLDYAASGYIEVEHKNDFLLMNLEQLMKQWKKERPSSQWNNLQKHMIANRNNNVIAIAETGMGKTEAGLLWIGNNKGFFTLPLKTAINAIYDRISKDIIKNNYNEKVGLLHSDTYSEYLNNNIVEIDIDEYFSKTKQLSLPITVCTLDQIFDFVYRYRGFESKLATLSYSKIVIDEVQMYSADLIAYLIIGLSYITKIGGKFAILTATLPNIVQELLLSEGIEFVPPKTFTNDNRIRHSVKVINDLLNTEYIVDLYDENKVLVICNTVREAQRIAKELEEDFAIPNVNLFHSSFIKRDRKEKEKKILDMGSRESKEHGIWVTTQVVEASLDIDFDILATELSDLNGLFQRMGRCYRNREFDKNNFNCHVFDGGSKECTGIGHVIDKDIFNMSKEALKTISGKLPEKVKMELVRDLYTTDKLRNTKYFKLIKSNIDYVKSIENYEMNKEEMRKRFRNINSMTVIPEGILLSNNDEIHEYIKLLSKGYDKKLSLEERNEIKVKKVIARSKLMEFSLSVPHHRAKDNIIEHLKVNRYESIPILRCNYSSKKGLEYINSEIMANDLTQNFI